MLPLCHEFCSDDQLLYNKSHQTYKYKTTGIFITPIDSVGQKFKQYRIIRALFLPYNVQGFSGEDLNAWK